MVWKDDQLFCFTVCVFVDISVGHRTFQKLCQSNVFARDIAVCNFFFPAQGNQLVESFVYYYGDIDIQSNYNSVSAVSHNQQDGSQ
jgi:hypothetical protein